MTTASASRNTLILHATYEDARRLADKYLGTDPPATVVQAGRLVALQHPRLDESTPEALETLAYAYNLPLLRIDRRAPLAEARKALPAASSAGGK